jgi:hypothetical protein
MERRERLLEILARAEPIPQGLAASYRDPDLKAILLAETAEKCAYCESKITHVYYGDVEHLIPKDTHPELMLTPENLTIACAICNNNKGNYYDAAAALINPYTDDTEVEFMAAAFFLMRRPGRDRARLTIELLQLNRPALIERRRERIESLANLADQFAKAAPGKIKDLIRDELIREASSDREYAYFVQSYLRDGCALEVGTGETRLGRTRS